MRIAHLKYLACPKCRGELTILKAQKVSQISIEVGVLQCSRCSKEFEIICHIPRFCFLENYASSFGFQWTKHAKTQYDSYTETNITETKFFNVTKWNRKLNGELILEVGSGSGRFTEQAASTGAFVVSMDYTSAVDVNNAINGDRDNVLIVQADIYNTILYYV